LSTIGRNDPVRSRKIRSKTRANRRQPTWFRHFGRKSSPFDLTELDGGDLRRNPLIAGKAGGPDVLRHACKLGLEGISAA
jgi:hypothetical protein